MQKATINLIKNQTDAINIPANYKGTKYSDINKKKSDTKTKNNNSKQQIIKKAKQQTNTNKNKQPITIKPCKNNKTNIKPDNKDEELILRWLKKIEQKETKPELWYKNSKQLQEEDEKETINTIIDECLKVITKQEEALSKQEFKYLFRNTFQTNKARKIYNLALMCFKDMKIYHKTTQLATNILTEMMHMIKNYKKYDKQSFKKNIQALQNKNEYLTEQTKNIPKHISRFKKLCNKKQEQYIEQFFDNINQIISNNSDALDHLTNLMHTMERKNGMTF